MVAIYNFLWLRMVDYSAKYQLQSPTVDAFNGKIDEVQREAISLLSPYYAGNEKVRSLLKPFVRTFYGTSSSTGSIQQPTTDTEDSNAEEFYRVLSMSVTDSNKNILYPIFETQENEIAFFQIVPQRAASTAKNRVYYINYDELIQLYPQQALPYLMFYLTYPPAARLAFTYSQVSGEFIQTYDSVNTKDLAWDKNASNLLLYMLLEKYGISSRDDLLAEFGKLGIQETLTPAQ